MFDPARSFHSPAVKPSIAHFDAVYAYVFRFDIVSRWLDHAADRALARLRRLIGEALDEQHARPA